MKINFVAIVPVIFLDIVLAGVSVSLIALLFSVWVLFFSFLLSPILVISCHFFGLQSFTLLRFLFSLVLCGVSIGWIFPFAKGFARKLRQLFLNYLNYHKKVLLKD